MRTRSKYPVTKCLSTKTLIDQWSSLPLFQVQWLGSCLFPSCNLNLPGYGHVFSLFLLYFTLFICVFTLGRVKHVQYGFQHRTMISKASYSVVRNLIFLTLPSMRYNFNSLRLRQNGRRFADDTYKRIFLNENVRIAIKISLKFVPKGPINKIPALFQIMAWRIPGDKPLSEAMVVSLLTHKCVTRPQWVKYLMYLFC